VQDGTACDGWRPPSRGRRGAGGEEPVIGLAAGAGATPAAKPDAPARDPASCWPWMAAGGQEKK
jgi:hypothetical protein